MKKYISFLIALIFITSIGFSQTQTKEKPLSFTKQLPAEEVDLVILPQPNMKQVLEEANYLEKNSGIRLYGKCIYTDLDMESAGTWTDLEDGAKIWRLSITSKEALALTLYFNDFFLPYGSKLFLYNKNKTQIAGPYTSDNNPANGIFSTEMIHGDEIVLEYFEPENAIGEPILNISELGYAYRDVYDYSTDKEQSKYYSVTSDTCEININCPEGDNWQTEKQGVVKIKVYADGNEGSCTGSLINNSNEDCYPYILLAEHCYDSDDIIEDDFSKWSFTFNYESEGCENKEPLDDYYLSGCKFISQGNKDGGSDFLLIALNKYVNHLSLYYNGWDRSSIKPTSGVGIHHPEGDIRKISTYSSEPTLETPTIAIEVDENGYAIKDFTMAFQSAFDVRFTSGTTESGSSGSPLFNQNSLIIGTLTGGSSSCVNTDGSNIYGRFYYHWDKNGSNDDERLKPWLDPNNSGKTVLNGKTCSEAPIIIDFEADKTTIIKGNKVVFTTQNSLVPVSNVSYQWSIEGARYNTTLLSTKVATFDTVGVFDVTLEITTSDDYKTLTKEDYITVKEDGTISINEISDSKVNIYPNPTSDFIHIKLNSSFEKDVKVSVYDAFGKKINDITQIKEGNNLLNLDFSQKAQGIYFIHITSDKTNIIEQVSIIK